MFQFVRARQPAHQLATRFETTAHGRNPLKAVPFVIGAVPLREKKRTFFFLSRRPTFLIDPNALVREMKRKKTSSTATVSKLTNGGSWFLAVRPFQRKTNKLG